MMLANMSIAVDKDLGKEATEVAWVEGCTCSKGAMRL
jgi:hypothetical protein